MTRISGANTLSGLNEVVSGINTERQKDFVAYLTPKRKNTPTRNTTAKPEIKRGKGFRNPDAWLPQLSIKKRKLAFITNGWSLVVDIMRLVNLVSCRCLMER
jgi:hypothetical protein